VAVMGAAACGGSSPADTADDSYRDRLAEGDAAELMGSSWSSVSDVSLASTVAIAIVVDEERVEPSVEQVRAVGPGEPMQVNRLVKLKFEEIVSGGAGMGNELSMIMFGWNEYPNGERRPFVIDDTYPVVGDRVLVLLTKDPMGQDALFAQNAMLFLSDGRVIDTPRNGPVFDALEGISEDDLTTRLSSSAR